MERHVQQNRKKHVAPPPDAASKLACIFISYAQLRPYLGLGPPSVFFGSISSHNNGGRTPKKTKSRDPTARSPRSVVVLGLAPPGLRDD